MSYDYDDDTNEDGPKALRDLVKKLQRLKKRDEEQEARRAELWGDAARVEDLSGGERGATAEGS